MATPPSSSSGSEHDFPILHFDEVSNPTFPHLNFDEHSIGRGIETRGQKRQLETQEAEEPAPLAKRHQAADDEPEDDDIRPDDEPKDDDIAPPQSPAAEEEVPEGQHPFTKGILLDASFENVQFNFRVEKFKKNSRFSTENVLFKVTPKIYGKKNLPMLSMVPAIKECMTEALAKLQDYYDNNGMTNRQFILTINGAKIKNGINHR